MRAARIHSHGPIASTVIDDIPVPEIGPDEVLVRVAAASINPFDVNLIVGATTACRPPSLPYTLGTDLVGTVEEVGRLACRWRTGDRVVARLDPMRGGAFAEFAAVPAVSLAGMSSDAPRFECAAALPTAAGAAWQALFDVGRVKRGQCVLIHVDAGGIGSFAVQLAAIAGARVIATASARMLDRIYELGATHVLDNATEDFAAKFCDFDVVLDTIGGEAQQRSFSALRRGGTLVSLVCAPDERLTTAYHVRTAFVAHECNAARLSLLVTLLDAGMLRIMTDSSFALADVRAGLARAMAPDLCGQVFLTDFRPRTRAHARSCRKPRKVR